MKICAYCKKKDSLTKEHIWPKALLKKYTEGLKAYNKRNNNFNLSEPTIKDVCEKCNNGVLSQLDTYISNLYDDYMAKPLSPGDSAYIEYDYNLLLRSLLKISYNSSRASGTIEAKEINKRYADYILNGKLSTNIMLRLHHIIKDGYINRCAT